MAALEDPNTQRRGAVFIHYDIGSTSESDQPGDTPLGFQASFEVIQLSRLMSESLPIRFVAIHMCYDDKRLQRVTSLFNVLGRDKRIRFRFHCGKNIR